MLRSVTGGIILAVRAQPGAKKTVIAGVYGEGPSAQLKIAVQAPPVEGRANSALIAYLAEAFGVPRKSVELLSGELSRSKAFLIRSVTQGQAEAVIASQLRCVACYSDAADAIDPLDSDTRCMEELPVIRTSVDHGTPSVLPITAKPISEA